MYKPSTTYRLQFHKGFTFKDALGVLSYLQRLGIGAVYASPVFESTPGSTHGYDGLNPNKINPEIGTLEELEAFSRQLQQHQIGWVQDIVPNHLAFDPRNPWLRDVLKKGKLSEYAGFFDILWDTPGNEKLMVPFLGNTLEEEVSKRTIQLAFAENEFAFKYGDALYPVSPASLTKPLKAAQASNSIQQELDKINHDKVQLLDLLNNQVYRLCCWKETEQRMNYRRFFTVNGLICLNIQDPAVFTKFHELIISMVKKNIFQGLRIDHIDGLFDPKQYLDQLHKETGDDTYVVVEKILQPDEDIPADWKTHGNTGYDFLAIVNNLFTNRHHERLLTRFYYQLDTTYKTFEQQLRDKKRYILHHHMGGELNNLLQLFLSLQLLPPDVVPADEMKAAIAEFLVNCPVYRFYGNYFPLQEKEAWHAHRIFEKVRQMNAQLNPAINALATVLLAKPNENDEAFNKKALYFYQRCMQFSGPLMAKGLEDTLMYNFNRFIALNEVGDSPGKFGYDIDTYHSKMKWRQQQWPYSLNTTATHDTKRGEDVRARLNVLSEIAPEWLAQVEEWMQVNAPLKEKGFPDPNTEYFIYQALVGHYPMPGDDAADFKDRMHEFLQKSLREGKVHSDWTAPNEANEKAAKNFTAKLVDEQQPFRKSFEKFHKDVIDFGILNSLSQVMLKFTSPGIPDVYQGTEWWDFSFVDPDNRRPVDYGTRQKFLKSFDNFKPEPTFFKQLWDERYSGKIKLWLTHQLMQLRKQYNDVLTDGAYVPLKVKGRYKDHIIAFARSTKREMLMVIVPLHLATICRRQEKQWQQIDWADTTITIPEHIQPEGSSLLNAIQVPMQGRFAAKDLFRDLPMAIIKAELIPNAREAGILLHISSLSSAFGIGDMGPEAKRFANFLQHTQQRYWQLLPINPTEAGQGHSPYSATSTKAGNVLLISPELLSADGLLSKEDLSNEVVSNSGKTQFDKAAAIRKKVFDTAWKNFNTAVHERQQQAFRDFCEQEHGWLQDYALYSVMKEKENGKPWYEWPDAIKNRDKAALNVVAEKNQERLQQIKWLQYIFSQQWKALRKYCNDRDIALIGDLPFYVSYDSADVWSEPHLFRLDEKGNKEAVAGVPPDAFSEDGQLWGMPVFRWDVIKKDNYQWWVNRLKKNIELFDSVRLDHFRAFSAYWEVDGSETTARNGKWVQGPGNDLFNAIQKALGKLPFIAEDLGEIDEPVYQLRDHFQLPGMKVLQFAFGEETGISPHTPHNHSPNFLVYSGTHDNNTSLGWWREANQATKNALKQYTGRSIEEHQLPDLFCRMTYASTARIAILPMQDILGLDENARMNKPSTSDGNWNWRLLPGQITRREIDLLKEWTKIYNRK
jgi:malto-oligosyltrehalose synthase/4-alpha-glucanotransferase